MCKRKDFFYTGADIVKAILSREQWNIEGLMEDLVFARVSEKRYKIIQVEIEELRRHDIELHDFLEERNDIEPCEGAIPPILIGRRMNDGPNNENLVIDGFYRVAMALAAGHKTIEAFVPEWGTVYL
ncbi:hypothetical protein [Olivibacter jilunii]|uniref:hypothetical protein n=1 Tax=Olivibacter jilunii TaxID=985016 RepID=UPI0010315C58|nr:hypothetical protein [Olivibacter jilunii]